jgi:hypothetical protein
MSTALWLLALQGAMGAFDTLYYHELRARLPARAQAGTKRELWLHAVRALIYAILFGMLPHVAFEGAWTVVLAAMLLAEVVITLIDFAIEDDVRRPFGGVPTGERAAHALMGVVCGAMLAHLAPALIEAWHRPTQLTASAVPVPTALQWTLGLMAIGVLVSGLRDLAAAMGARAAAWPWRIEGASS